MLWKDLVCLSRHLNLPDTVCKMDVSLPFLSLFYSPEKGVHGKKEVAAMDTLLHLSRVWKSLQLKPKC